MDYLLLLIPNHCSQITSALEPLVSTLAFVGCKGRHIPRKKVMDDCRTRQSQPYLAHVPGLPITFRSWMPCGALHPWAALSSVPRVGPGHKMGLLPQFLLVTQPVSLPVIIRNIYLLYIPNFWHRAPKNLGIS